MKRPILSMLLSVLLLLPGCAQAPSGSSQEEGLTVLATTYPVYLFARTVAQGVEGVTVERLNTGSVSCLHDYTLSVDDMKKIEGADVIAMNGAGLEDFMDDALAASSAAVIDCSQGVALFENADHIHEEGDGGHDHGHWDPHYWMDPGNAAVMVRNLQEGFALADPDHGDAYARNGEPASCPALPATAPRPWRGQKARPSSPSTTASTTLPRPWACPCWPPSRRRRAARPAPWRSMRSPSW